VADEKSEDDEPGTPKGASAIGNKTMQVDAVLEEVAGDIAVPNDALAQVLPDGGVPQVSKPPPLPPKKVGTGTIIAGVVIVILAAGGGIFFGMQFLGAPEPAATQAAEPTVDEGAAALADEGEADDVDEEQLAADEGAEFVPIQLDEVVVSADDELEDEDETAEEEAPEE
jgi:hypothetical protein